MATKTPPKQPQRTRIADSDFAKKSQPPMQKFQKAATGPVKRKQ